MAKAWPKGFQVVAITPAWNEAKLLAPVISDLHECKKQGLLAEVIVVDDGSTDSTAQVAKNAGADKVISLKENRGKTNAVAQGVEYVTEKYAPRSSFKNAGKWMQRMDRTIVVMIDADIKGIRPEQVVRLVRPLLKVPNGKIRKCLNMVIGTRVRGSQLLDYQQFNGERAIRLRSLQAMRRGTKKWKTLISIGYSLETVLNRLIPKASYANTGFHLGREAGITHRSTVVGMNIEKARELLEIRKKQADCLREIRRISRAQTGNRKVPGQKRKI
ncbi:MAG: glycosyltransferase family 2 protein [archaeon]